MVRKFFSFILSMTFILAFSSCYSYSEEQNGPLSNPSSEKANPVKEEKSSMSNEQSAKPAEIAKDAINLSASGEQAVKPDDQPAKPKEPLRKKDKNKDGIWHYWVSKVRIKVGTDTNKDGKEDVWQFLDKDGNIIRVEQDTNFDSKIDVWQYKKNEVLEKAEADSDFNGKIDRIQYFKDGKLEKEEDNANKNGKMDT